MKLITIIAALVATLVSAENPTTDFKVFGNLYGMNNNWNDQGNKIKSTFSDSSNAEMKVSFNFNSAGLYGFPAIGRGWHYNINPVPNDKLFPRQPSTLKKIPVTFSYSAKGTNVAGDFALDIFLRSDTSKTTPELEIMIWGDHNSIPIGSKTETGVIKAGGRTFDLWEGNNDGTGYYVYSFVPTDSVGSSVGERKLAPKGSLNVDVKLFLNYLQKKAGNGKYNDNMYLDVIEAGFEVANGVGEVEMTATIDAM